MTATALKAIGAPHTYRTNPEPLTDSRARNRCCIAVRHVWKIAAATVTIIHIACPDSHYSRFLSQYQHIISNEMPVQVDMVRRV